MKVITVNSYDTAVSENNFLEMHDLINSHSIVGWVVLLQQHKTVHK